MTGHKAKLPAESEICIKERRVRKLLEKEGLHALAISTTANFAWLTCGGSNYVSTATEVGSATAIITRDAKFIVCDNIEAPRIMTEEIAGQGFELCSCHWYEDRKPQLIRQLAAGGALGSETPLDGARNVAALIDPLRWSLTAEEIDRYRWLGARTGECLTRVAREITPGMTEHEISSMLVRDVVAFGGVPTIALVAVDERIAAYRHPLPTDKKLERAAMLVIGAKKWGLIVSATRMVHFGQLSAELRRKHDAVLRIDAVFNAATKPGAVIGDVFEQGISAYEQAGFPNEWRLHHQGGPTGYKGREFKANSESAQQVLESQAFAWNPSITGTKSEDTIITTASGLEIISASPDWPMVETNTLLRPDILVR